MKMALWCGRSLTSALAHECNTVILWTTACSDWSLVCWSCREHVKRWDCKPVIINNAWVALKESRIRVISSPCRWAAGVCDVLLQKYSKTFRHSFPQQRDDVISAPSDLFLSWENPKGFHTDVSSDICNCWRDIWGMVSWDSSLVYDQKSSVLYVWWGDVSRQSEESDVR